MGSRCLTAIDSLQCLFATGAGGIGFGADAGPSPGGFSVPQPGYGAPSPGGVGFDSGYGAPPPVAYPPAGGAGYPPQAG